MSRKKELVIIIALIIAISILIFSPFILTDMAFILDMDMRSQYQQTFLEFQDMIINAIKSKSLPFYSFDMFLGTNFWASKLFLNITLFEWLALPFKNIDYQYIVMILTGLKFIVSAIGCYIFGKVKSWKFSTIVLLVFSFTFSSYALDAVRDPFFLSFYVMIPLYFCAMENYLLNGKKNGYIIITAIMLFTSYYHFFALSILSVVYFIYRFYQINGKIKGFFKKAIPLIGAYIVAVLICGISLVPILYDITNNSRVFSGASGLLHDKQTYFSILLGNFYPSSLSINRLGETSTIFNTNITYSSTTPLRLLLFTSYINIALIHNVLKSKSNRFLLALIGIFISFPIFSSVFNGFSEPSFRWLMYVVFFICILSAEAYDKTGINISYSFKITVIVSCALVIIYPLYPILFENIENYKGEYLLILLSTILFFMQHMILRYKNNSKVMATILVTQVILITQWSFFLNPYYRTITNSYKSRVESVLGDRGQLSEFLNYVDENNYNSFYRIYAPYNEVYWLYSLNMNLHYDFMGVMSYDSTFAPSLKQLDKIVNQHDFLPWTFNISDASLIDQLGVKYAIVANESQLPYSEFIYLEDYFGLQLYENVRYYNFVRTFDKAKNYDEIVSSTDLSDYLVVEKEIYDSLEVPVGTEYKGVDYVNYGNNQISFEMTLDVRNSALTMIPFDRGWKVFSNGNRIPTFEANGGMLAIVLEEGYNYVEMVFVPVGFKLGVVLSSIGILILIYSWMFHERNKKSPKVNR